MAGFIIGCFLRVGHRERRQALSRTPGRRPGHGHARPLGGVTAGIREDARGGAHTPEGAARTPEGPARCGAGWPTGAGGKALSKATAGRRPIRCVKWEKPNPHGRPKPTLITARASVSGNSDRINSLAKIPITLQMQAAAESTRDMGFCGCRHKRPTREYFLCDGRGL